MKPAVQPPEEGDVFARVVHIGNDVDDHGGISSVIRNHLGRDFRKVRAHSVATYTPSDRRLRNQVATYLRALVYVARLPGKGHVAHIHVSQGGSLLREGSLVLLCRIKRVPAIITLHGSSLSNPSSITRLALRILTAIGSRVHGFGDIYRSTFRIRQEKWVRLPNDVEMPSGKIPPVQARPRRVVFAGEVGRRKGIDIAIAAWELADLKGWELSIAGNITSDVAHLVERAAQLSSVSVLGSISREQVAELLLSTKILIQPSRAEAFPMSVCEALASGCAVIGSRVGALGELLDAANQVSIEQSAESLARALRLLATHESLLERKTASAVNFAQSTLATNVLTPEWESLYVNILSARKTPQSITGRLKRR